jgi:N-carbamoylputrescine amidase
MRVTVCEFADEPAHHEACWTALVEHARAEASDLVLLPEMALAGWFPRTRPFDPAVWNQAVAAHDAWMARLEDLAPACVLGSRPVLENGRRLNRAFVCEPGRALTLAHAKYYLPDEAGFWEATWYSRGDGRFEPVTAGAASIGFLICTDLWFLDRARAYGRAGVHVILNPRGTERATVDKWLVGGRAAAIVSGAYSLSSNRVGGEPAVVPMGGRGWIVAPDGEVLALTSESQPFVTMDIDLGLAERAKSTYPRYVAD